MGARSEITGARHIQPAAAAHQYDKLIQDCEAIRTQALNHVEGLMVETPTTGSTQITGAGATDWNVNLRGGIVIVDGVSLDVAPAADYDVHTGSLYTGLIATYSAIATLVAKNVAGVVSLQVVKGTAALTASVVAPTDAEIQAAVGAGNAWVKICEMTINRTADTTVTQSQANKVRPLLGVNVDAAVGDWSSFT
jgi:hypothetical protein